MNIWIGDLWRTSPRRKLVLGESWWGPEESVQQYLRRWCANVQADTFFTRIFNACSGYTASAATTPQKLGFWDELAFMNFVYWSVGKSNTSKANAADFRAAVPDLRNFLQVLQPAVVWILGTTQAAYSERIVQNLGIHAIVSKHPRSGISDADLLRDFKRL